MQSEKWPPKPHVTLKLHQKPTPLPLPPSQTQPPPSVPTFTNLPAFPAQPRGSTPSVPSVPSVPQTAAMSDFPDSLPSYEEARKREPPESVVFDCKGVTEQKVGHLKYYNVRVLRIYMCIFILCRLDLKYCIIHHIMNFRHINCPEVCT